QHFDSNSSILKVLTRWNSNILKEIVEEEIGICECKGNISLQFIWKEENWLELAEAISELIEKYIRVPCEFFTTIELLEKLLHLDTDLLDEFSNRIFEWVNSKII
ncbi:TPA: hypothetical protein QC104_006006, partial [Bacillus cereus]|nr:hypothetical protein [Bacillus cereus]